MSVWAVFVDRLGGAGYEDWTDYVDPWPEAELETVAVARAGSARITFTEPPQAPEKGWQLRVTRNGVEQFEGRITGVGHRRQGSTIGPAVYAVTASDFDTLLDDDVVPHVYRSANETAGERIKWLVDTFGTHGITADPPFNQDILTMPGGSDGRPEQEFGPSTLREAIAKVTKISGGQVYVDFDKRLHHFLDEAIAAPFGLSDTPDGITTFDYFDFRLDDDDTPRVDEVVVFGAEGLQVTRTVPSPPPPEHRRRAPLVDDKITSIEQAEAAGDAFLLAHRTRRSGSLKTLAPGLTAGMDVQITHQGHGFVAETFRIHTVRTTFDGPDDSAVYEVKFGDLPLDMAELIGGIDGSRTVARGAAAIADESIRKIADLQAGGANLVRNSSFENSTLEGWSVGAFWTFGSAQPDAFHGGKVARVALAAQTSGVLASHKVPVERLHDYWLSAWTFVRSLSSGTLRVAVRELNGSDAVVQETVVDELTAATTGWVRSTIRMGPNDQLGRRAFHADTVSIRLVFYSVAAATAVWDVDAVQVERGTLLTAYAPAPQELVDGQIGTTQIADDAITTPKVAANAIVAGKIASAAVTTDKLDAGAVTTDKLAAAGVTADKIAAGSIGARQLAVGAPRPNLLVNGDFEENDGVSNNFTNPSQFPGWQLTSSVISASPVESANAKSGRWVAVIRLDAGAPTSVGLRQIVPVRPGRTYRLSGWAWKSAAGGQQAQIIAHSIDKNGSVVAFNVLFPVANSSTTPIFGEDFWTAPDGVAGLQVYCRWGGTAPSTSERFAFEDITLEEVPGGVVNGPTTTIIDENGITVTNGAIVVENPNGTVIIDGTSNMFKIVATGTVTHTQAANSSGVNEVAIPGTGLPGVSPAFIGYLTEGTSPGSTANRDLGRFDKLATGFVAQTSGGGTIQRMKYILWAANAFSSTESGSPSISLAIDNADSVSHGAFMRYHILKEAAI